MFGALFQFYRFFLSPLFQVAFGIQCRYEESCSRYMERNIRERGAIKGILLGLKRILSCNSWRAHG